MMFSLFFYNSIFLHEEEMNEVNKTMHAVKE